MLSDWLLVTAEIILLAEKCRESGWLHEIKLYVCLERGALHIGRIHSNKRAARHVLEFWQLISVNIWISHTEDVYYTSLFWSAVRGSDLKPCRRKGRKEAEAEAQAGYRSFPAPREQTSGCGIVKWATEISVEGAVHTRLPTSSV